MVDAAMSTAAPDPERDSAEGRREERNARRAARQTLLTISKTPLFKSQFVNFCQNATFSQNPLNQNLIN
jgi:hypothetical protein